MAEIVVKKRKAAMPGTQKRPSVQSKPVAKPKHTDAEQAARRAAIRERQRTEQQAAKQRRYVENQRLLNVLAEKWPHIFMPDVIAGYAVRPLKIGIDRDIMAALQPEYSSTKVRRAIGIYFYVVRWKYLKALVAGGPRFDLDGHEGEPVTTEQQERARIKLEALQAKIQTRLPNKEKS
jgi:ProP effector